MTAQGLKPLELRFAAQLAACQAILIPLESATNYASSSKPITEHCLLSAKDAGWDCHRPTF
jgi:hypothetical protein